MRQYRKIRFTGPAGATAGLILDTDKYKSMSIDQMSRLYPYTEANKMHRFEVSPVYATWEQAFEHEFDSVNP